MAMTGMLSDGASQVISLSLFFCLGAYLCVCMTSFGYMLFGWYLSLFSLFILVAGISLFIFPFGQFINLSVVQ